MQQQASKRPPMPWRARGPSFNSWWEDYRELSEALLSVQGQAWWIKDFDLKYLNLRIDTRDLGFLLTDGDGNHISPRRVLDAIAAFKERFPGEAA